MSIRIELRDKELRAALSRLVTAGEDLSPATAAVAAHLLRVTEDAFEQERDPATGEAWAPLSEVTVNLPPSDRRGRKNAAPRGPGHPLQVSRNLLNSILADYDATTAVVGTNLKYATTQHYGAERGKFGRGNFKTKKGSFPIPWGDIPARPFFGVSPDDERAITDIIADHIASAWPG